MAELINDFSYCVGFTIDKVHSIVLEDCLSYTILHFTNGHILVQMDDSDGWTNWSVVLYDLKGQNKELKDYLEPYLK